MDDMQDLLAQRAEIDRQIAARKAEAIADMKSRMAALGITLEDLGARPARVAPPAPAKRPVKFKDEKGNTWTGIGQRPRWLQKALAAGKTLEDFAVRKTG